MTMWKLPDCLGGGEMEGVEVGSSAVFFHPEAAITFTLPKSVLTEGVTWPAGTFFVDQSGDAWIVDGGGFTATIISIRGTRASDTSARRLPIAEVRQEYGPLIRLVPEPSKEES